MRHNRDVNQSNMNLQGAIDLGAVAAAREAQAKAAQAAAQRAADPVASNLIIDVTTSIFEADVITKSMTVPVVVDLWATGIRCWFTRRAGQRRGASSEETQVARCLVGDRQK
jgi:hypothetical protein